jgi:uncharacterized protein YjbI with pentapeptide repeats
LSFEPDAISLKLDKSLTRADVEKMLEQQGDSANLNLSGLNLSVIDFAGMDLSGAAFTYAHLNGANLLEANLENATFNSARLNGVKGRRVRLDQADLANASMIEAKLEEASFTGAVLTRTNLSGADLRRANLSEATLNGTNLSEADLTGANLANANLSQANLSRAILRDTDLSHTDLRGAVLGGAKLEGARLDGANLSQVRLLLANLHNARLSQAILNQTDFSWSDLGEANLSKADLTGAKLIETDLTGADLRDAILQQANFSGANLSDTRLVGANLAEVSLSGATLNGAYLSDEQKEMLASSGDVLGLDQTRSAQELHDLEAAQRLLEELAHPTNGFVSETEMNGLRQSGQTEADLEATFDLPSLAGPTPAESQAPADYAETELPPLFPNLTFTGQNSYQTAPAFVQTPVSTVSLIVKETPVAVSGLARLLDGLDRLYSSLTLIRQEKFAELVEFYGSPDSQPGLDPANRLSIKSFDAATGHLILTAPDAALTALNSALAAISSPSVKIEARELAGTVLESFSPGLDPVVKAITAQTLVENFRQLAAGPPFDLAAAPPPADATGEAENPRPGPDSGLIW